MNRLTRNLRIALEHVHGATLHQLAEQYEVSPGRIHQIYVDTMAKTALTRYDIDQQRIRLLEHLRAWEARDRAKSNTPEHFYLYERGQLDDDYYRGSQ